MQREELGNTVAGWVEKILASCPAREAELNLSYRFESLTRFAENQVHQHLTRATWYLSLRGVWGEGTVRWDLAPGDLERLPDLWQGMEHAARNLEQRLPFLPVLAPPQEYRREDRWHDEVARWASAQRARLVKDLVAAAEQAGARAGGFVANRVYLEAYANSAGLFIWYPWTEWEVSTTWERGRQSIFLETSHWRWTPDQFDEALAELRARAALLGRVRSLPAGDYTAILEPTALSDLLSFVAWPMNGLEILEGSSPLTRHVGHKVFGDNIVLEDDPFHPLLDAVPFDGEGVPRRPLRLVDHGVFVQPVYDRMTAQRAGAQPTGHGFPSPNPYGAIPDALVLHGEERSFADLCREMGEGVVIPRAWYVRLVEPAEIVVTGLTRDGALWVEKGRPRAIIEDLRFNQSLIEMLNRVRGFGQVRRAGEEFAKYAVPPVLVERFHFAARAH